MPSKTVVQVCKPLERVVSKRKVLMRSVIFDILGIFGEQLPSFQATHGEER